MIDAVRISGVRVIHNRVNKQEMEVSMNVCSESKIEYEENVDRLWNERALKFCSEGGVIESSQRESLWRVVENFREVFADVPGRARNYECELKVREHAPLSLIHICIALP